MTPTGHPPKGLAMQLAAMAALTAAVMLSAYASTYMLHDSFWINLVWGDQFSRQVAEGTLYPRWLPQSHDGLGSPVFYFYPPLAFHLMAAFTLTGMSVYASMMAAFASALLASGLTMHLWLQRVGNWTFAGALLYMIAPYHLFDFLKRGALAEFAAFVWLPLIALGIHRAARGRGCGLLAFSYAALILTHLPAALIATIFLVLPYGAKEIVRERTSAFPLALGGVLGLGLAAIYLLPMAYFMDSASLQIMTTSALQQTKAWSIYLVADWPATLQPFIVAFALVYFAGGVMLAAITRRFWAIAAVIVLLLTLGVLPGLWSLPGLTQVQFPWRTFMIVEFMAVTAFAAVPKRAPMLWLLPAAMACVSLLIARPVMGGRAETTRWMLTKHPDVAEYLPPGSPHKPELFSSWALGLAEARKARSVGDPSHRAAFIFPTMILVCNDPAKARQSAPLITWDARECSLKRVMSPPERLGIAITLATAALMALLAISRRRRKQADDSTANAAL